MLFQSTSNLNTEIYFLVFFIFGRFIDKIAYNTIGIDIIVLSVYSMFNFCGNKY